MRAKQDRAGDAERRARHGVADPRRRGLCRRGHRAGDAQPQPVGGLHGPAARCTWSSTTRSASSPRRPRGVRAPTPPTWPRCCRSPSSTSTAKTRKPWRRSCGWRWTSAVEFKRDVVIDMYCYRRRGHNEERRAVVHPAAALSRDRAAQRSVRDSYLERLLQLGEITREEADRIAEEQTSQARTGAVGGAQQRLRAAERGAHGRLEKLPWRPGLGGRRRSKPAWTAASSPSCSWPRPCCRAIFIRIRRSSASSRRVAKWPRGKRPLDWAAAEALAFASLADAGCRIRLSGQDSDARHVQPAPRRVARLPGRPSLHAAGITLSKSQAPVEIINSPLSEAGVLGFEYGYSLDCPSGLVLWEAQFGDFVNAAQVIIDQFIASAEDKWQRLSGLVLLLPHGFEGMGPEHSSARLERFLELAADYEHPDRRSHHAGPVFPLPPAAGAAGLAQAAGRDDPQEPAAPSAGGLQPRRLRQRAFRQRDSRRAPICPMPTACCFAPASSITSLSRRARSWGGSDVAIVRIEQFYPAADEAAGRGLGAVPRRNARLLGAGRAGEHGSLAVPAGALRHRAVRPLAVLGHFPPRVRAVRRPVRPAATRWNKRSC